MKKRRIKLMMYSMCVFLLMVLGLLSLTPGNAYALAEIDGYGMDYETFSYSSDTGPVSHLGVYTKGYADAATQTLRAYAIAHANSSSLIDASFSNILTVNEGTSGLSTGDPVSLRLSIGFDGYFDAGSFMCPSVPCVFPDSGIDYGSSVQPWANYNISETKSILVEIEEGYFEEQWIREELTEFNFHGDVRSEGMSWDVVNAIHGDDPVWIALYDPEHDGLWSREERWDWNLSSNNGTLIMDGSSYGGDVDIGVRTIDFQTYIGAQLDISAIMSISPFVSSHGGNAAGVAYGEFMNTFGAGITSPYTSGIELSYAVAPAIVPEPISSVLFVTGGTLLAGRRFLKRKKV